MWGFVLRRTILLSALSLLLFCGLFEGAIRLIGPDLSMPAPRHAFRFEQTLLGGASHHVRDAQLGWALKPNLSARFDRRAGASSRGGQGVLSTSSRGFRGGEFEIVKPEHVFRIAFFGDSNPMGFGNSDEEIHAVRVAEILNGELERAPEGTAPDRVESINFAVDGYTSHQTRLLLERYVPAIGADVVCLQVGFNDHTLSPVPDAEYRFDRPALLGALETSHAYRWMRRQILGLAGGRRMPGELAPRVSLDDYADNVSAMVDRSLAAGAHVVLLTTPADPAAPLVVSEVAIERDGRREWTTPSAWVLERMRALGVDPPDDPRQSGYLEAARAVVAERTDWAYAHYVLERALVAAGRAEEARAARLRWRAMDAQRQSLERYMRRLREIARAERVDLVDVGDVIAEGAAQWNAQPRDLFLDFVHLDARGQLAVALEIVEIVRPLAMSVRASD